MNIPPIIERYRAEILLGVVLLLSGILNIWNLWNQGISNDYYAAAVKSMLENPGLIFFNSFDAGGFVTVDKPPVGLWVQIAFAALLGFSGWILVLPQALAGVGSVALLYVIVSRPFGKTAGLISALALAITPMFVAVSRNGTMDGQLIFVLLLAVWAALKAARDRSLPFLLLSVVLVGIGFNIKMIQAFIVVPALLAIYFLGAGTLPLKRRAVHIALAVCVLLAVSLSWAVAVDLVPASDRPYIGGSGDNTVLGLIINYNGMNRLENGMSGRGAGGMPPGGFMPGGQDAAAGAAAIQNRTADRGNFADRTGPGNAPPGMEGPPEMAGGMPAGSPGSDAGTAGMPGGRMGENGTPGLFRLFTQELAGQVSWLLPFALAGLLAWWRRPSALSVKGFEEAGYCGERGLTLLAMGLWLLPGLLYFSFTTGFWHPYYLATIAPPLAALTGIGALGLYEAYLGEGPRSWLLVAVVPLTGIVQTIILLYDAAWSAPLIPLVAGGTAVATLSLAHLKIRKMPGATTLPQAASFIAIAILFIAPFVWASTPLVYGSGGALPAAGPGFRSGVGPGVDTMGTGFPGGGPRSIGSGEGNATLARYLASHNTGERWDVAVSGSHNGSDLIISYGLSVMSLGGFSGTDRILTPAAAQELVSSGKVRYFLMPGATTGGGGGMAPDSNDIATWVSSSCTQVPAAEYGGTISNVSSLVVDQGRAMGTGNVTAMWDAAGFAGMQSAGGGMGMRDGGDVLYDCRVAAGSS